MRVWTGGHESLVHGGEAFSRRGTVLICRQKTAILTPFGTLLESFVLMKFECHLENMNCLAPSPLFTNKSVLKNACILGLNF